MILNHELSLYVLQPPGSCEAPSLAGAYGAAVAIAERYEALGALHEPLALAGLYGTAMAAKTRLPGGGDGD